MNMIPVINMTLKVILTYDNTKNIERLTCIYIHVGTE